MERDKVGREVVDTLNQVNFTSIYRESQPQDGRVETRATYGASSLHMSIKQAMSRKQSAYGERLLP
jgi:hypothetical protein